MCSPEACGGLLMNMRENKKGVPAMEEECSAFFRSLYEKMTKTATPNSQKMGVLWEYAARLGQNR